MDQRISYNHPQFSRIQREVEEQVSTRFNSIRLAVIEKYYNNDGAGLVDNIHTPNFKKDYLVNANLEEVWRGYCEETGSDVDELERYPQITDILENNHFVKWLENNDDYSSFEDEEISKNYPTWSTVFEAREEYLSEWIINNAEKVCELGFGIIDPDPECELNVILFFTGGGYDFYEAHWIPLFLELGWVEVEEAA